MIVVFVSIHRVRGELAGGIQIRIASALVVEIQRLGKQKLRLFHTPDYADVRLRRRIELPIGRIDQLVRCPVSAAVRHPSYVANTKGVDVIFESGHGRVCIAEIDHIDRPLCNRFGSDTIA